MLFPGVCPFYSRLDHFITLWFIDPSSKYVYETQNRMELKNNKRRCMFEFRANVKSKTVLYKHKYTHRKIISKHSADEFLYLSPRGF